MSAPRIEKLAEGVTLYLGDCRDIMPTLGEFDSVVTDPPYKFERSNRPNQARGKAKNNPTYVNLFEDGLHVGFCLDDLPEANNVIVFCAKNQLPILLPKIWNVDDQRWMLIVWNKSKHQYLSGSYAPDTEYILHFWKNGCLGERGLPRFFFGASEQTTPHPTEKPVWLMKALLKATTGKVLDPFMGSGTTGVASVQMGRKFIGIEHNQNHFDLACRRIAAALDSPKLFSESPAFIAKQEALL